MIFFLNQRCLFIDKKDSVSHTRLWHFVLSNLWRQEQKSPYNEAVLLKVCIFFPFYSGSSLVALLIISVMEMLLSCLSATTKQQSATQLISSNSSIFFAPPSSTQRFVDSLRSFNLWKRGEKKILTVLLTVSSHFPLISWCNHNSMFFLSMYQSLW